MTLSDVDYEHQVVAVDGHGNPVDPDGPNFDHDACTCGSPSWAGCPARLHLLGQPCEEDHCDLDDAINQIAAQRLTINRVRHILDSGYGCTACALADLRQAVGLEPSPTPHEEHL